MAVATDSFTDTASVALTSHTADTGHTWFLHPAYSAGTNKIVISNANAIRMVGSSPITTLDVLSNTPAAPASGNYDVTWDFVVKTNVGSAGVVVGYSSTADTGYILRVSNTSWAILRMDAGTPTTLASDATNLTPAAGTTYNMTAEVRTTGITFKRNGSTICSTSDTTYTGVLRQGVRFTNVAMTDTTGIHIDNFSVVDSNVVPVLTSAPVMSGSRVQGFTLSTTDGSWTNSPTSYTYKWQTSSDGGANYTDIVGATANTYTLTSTDVSHLIRAVVTATNAAGSGTPANSNALTVVANMVSGDITFLKSGSSNIGGTPGAAVTDPRSVFDDVLRVEADAGDIEYRLLYVKNSHEVQALNSAVAWISSQTTSASTDLAIGVATESAGNTVTAVANEDTAPAGVTFSVPSSSGSGLALGDIPAGSHRGLWFRWTVTTGAPATGTDSATVNWQGTPT